MFNILKSLIKSQKPIIQREVVVEFSSLICETTVSTGNILIRRSIRIDGKHIGKIVKDPESLDEITVIVAKNGIVEGTINADNIIIEGTMRGVTKANIALHVFGSIEGTAFYGEHLEICGQPSAQIIRLSKKQIHIAPDISNLIPTYPTDSAIN